MSASNPYKKVFELLHRPRRAAFLKGEGDSAAYRPQVTITRADFLAHCRDEQCIALGCVNARGEALFLAWDIDRHFYRRLGALRAALDRRGWAEAALIVDGSGVGRGKVLLLLASPIPQEQAVGIAPRGSLPTPRSIRCSVPTIATTLPCFQSAIPAERFGCSGGTGSVEDRACARPSSTGTVIYSGVSTRSARRLSNRMALLWYQRSRFIVSRAMSRPSSPGRGPIEGRRASLSSFA